MAKSKNPVDRIDDQIAQLQARKKRIVSKDRQRARKIRDGCMIELGALITKHIQEFPGKDPELEATVYRLINRYVDRDERRDFFRGIWPELPEQPSGQPATEQDREPAIKDTFQTKSG